MSPQNIKSWLDEIGKRLRRQRGIDGDELVIMSDNPVIAPQVVPLEDVHIIGKLVWVGRRM